MASRESLFEERFSRAATLSGGGVRDRLVVFTSLMLSLRGDAGVCGIGRGTLKSNVSVDAMAMTDKAEPTLSCECETVVSKTQFTL